MSSSQQTTAPPKSVNGPDKRWLSIGRRYNANDPNNPSVLKEIPVMEMARSVSMDEDVDPGTHRKEPYGQPIDAPLAVHLISNLLVSLKKYNIMPTLEEYDFQLGVNARTEGANDDKGEARQEATPEVLRGIDPKIGLQWMIHLLVHSKAITFDKSPLLKIISQPKCEGVRFYLCLTPHKQKPTPKDTHSDISPFAPLEDGVLSLVLVGVDEKGHDLNYDGPINKNSQHPDLTTLADGSVLDEYGHPPGTGFTFSPKTAGESAYTLWTYAFNNVQGGTPL